MSKMFNIYSCIIAAAGGIFTYLFGAWDGALRALIILMSLDYITGIVKAVYKRELSSRTGFDGLLRKAAVLTVVALANVIQTIAGGAAAVREVVIMFYIANEGISILENSAEVIPNMPDCIKNILMQLRSGD